MTSPKIGGAMGGENPGVVLFPGVGSFGGELRQLLRELRPSARMARYPGRFGADAGSAHRSFREVVESCATQVRRQERSRPVLVGHSFGAYVAYATARKLEELGTDVSALVVAAAAAPGLLSVPGSAIRDRSGTAAFLDGIVDEPPSEWGDTVLDAVVQDLRLLTEFSESAYGKVRCPILAARGEADPATSTSGIREWAGVTISWCAHKVFPGGHSDWLSSPQFASWLRHNSFPVLEPDPSGGP
jgi:surfactin synthase thioesterase subunit